MGSYDGAEVCEVVGLFMLDIISKKYLKENIGLYRDDGLSVFKNQTGHQNDKVRKELIRMFQDHHLKLEIKCNLKSVDYLDITFDLTTGTYKPFNKMNNNPRYINANSNHPPSIVRDIPESVSKRITTNSCNENIFNAAAPFYNDILKNCGYINKIKYSPDASSRSRNKNRPRNIIWYNPPFSKNVKTNVAKTFLKLLNKHFGKTHKYHKIFNRNNVKISYSCMNSMSKIINAHNSKIANKEYTENDQILCNCRNRNDCPLDGKCLSSKIVYSAEVTTETSPPILPGKIYLGICDTEFKTRYGNHKKSFRHRRYEKDTELSKYIWELKDQNKNFEIKWSIYRKSCGYNQVAKSCNLCLMEKVLICNFKDKERLINKRVDLVSKCRHENKFILLNYSGID